MAVLLNDPALKSNISPSVSPDQTQTYGTDYSPYFAGAERVDQPSSAQEIPLDVRKVIARRSLLEFGRGEIANLGFGISQNIGAIAQEEGVADLLARVDG